jgi:hypothetical protein
MGGDAGLSLGAIRPVGLGSPDVDRRTATLNITTRTAGKLSRNERFVRMAPIKSNALAVVYRGKSLTFASGQRAVLWRRADRAGCAGW